MALRQEGGFSNPPGGQECPPSFLVEYALQGWSLFMPLGRLLVGVGDTEASRFLESRRDELDSRRQIPIRETARQGDRRQAS